MKYLVICTLILAGVLLAGCTGTQAPPVATPPPTTVPVTTTVPPTTSAPSFTLGDHYLQKSYTFNTEGQNFSEEFRIPQGQPWALQFNVLPLNDDLQYCWFAIKVTNMNTGQDEVFGYGREKSFEKSQMYPMYGYGPYTVEMTGNKVRVDVTAAKRNP